MVEISKEEIKQYLLKNQYFFNDFTREATTRAIEAEKVYGSIDEIKIANKLFSIFSSIKVLAYMKDRNYKELKESDIKMDYKHLFYDQNEANQFSQREIIGLIRNALCHNNTNNYKVMLDDDNSIFLEIDMMTKDLKRFHVRLYDIAIMSMIIELNNTDSLKCGRYLSEINCNEFLYGECRKSVKTKYYYVKEKNLTDTEKYKITSKKTSSLIHSNNINITEYPITDKQQQTINAILPSIKQSIIPITSKITDEQLIQIVDSYIHASVDSTIPDGLYKISQNIINIIITMILQSENYNISYNELSNLLLRISTEKQVTNNNLINRILPEYKDQLRSYLLFKDLRNNNLMILLSYILENSNDDTITIGSTTYDKNKLRNSVTHGRWHINYDTGIVTFYDYRKEYDYNFEEDIYMGDLYNFVYFNTMTENIKKKLH